MHHQPVYVLNRSHQLKRPSQEIITGFIESSGGVKSLENENLMLNQKIVKRQSDNEGLQSDFNK